ncbi:YkgB family protein [Bradyrhizobium ivorense]|uniref:YkgB family protein n=1 Tax=Bradyrhizobium ivorense TaxID=2511166 RepID=UPI00322140C4
MSDHRKAKRRSSLRVRRRIGASHMDALIAKLSKLDIVRGDFDYHFVRATMIIVFLVFSCQKWFDYEAHALIPFISHGPLIFWLYPVFGIRGAAFFLGSAEFLIGALLLLGFWNRRLAVLGSLGSCATYVATVTIIPFFPEAWAAPAGGFPAATLPFLFLVKDIVLLSASVYLLKQDILRASNSERWIAFSERQATN